jgi:hypothetical protein
LHQPELEDHVVDQQGRTGREPKAQRAALGATFRKKPLGWTGSVYMCHVQWIGLRENLQETMVFTIKYRGFL